MLLCALPHVITLIMPWSFDPVRSLFIRLLFSFLYIYFVEFPLDQRFCHSWTLLRPGAFMFYKHMSSFSYILTIVNYFQLLKDVFAIGNKTIKTFLTNIKIPHRSSGGRERGKSYYWVRFWGEILLWVRFSGDPTLGSNFRWEILPLVRFPLGNPTLGQISGGDMTQRENPTLQHRSHIWFTSD